MLLQIIATHIFSACILMLYIESATVEFDSSEFFRIKVPYKLKINNDNPRQKFPSDNFVFAFELLTSLNPRSGGSIGDVSSSSYTGDEYHGFSIKGFNINEIDQYIEMDIEFRREAHGNWFQIRYSSASTENAKFIFYNQDTNSGVIFKKYIKILLPYTITIKVRPEIQEVISEDKDVLDHVLLPDKNGQLTCSASDGLPNSMPKFINSYDLLGATVNAVNNDVTQLVWMVRLQDHGKQIICKAGHDQKDITLKVYHYMTNVLSDPVIEVKQPRGSHIKCYSKDGYPIPKTYWVYVSGPLDARNYYEFQKNDTVLYINNTAPLNSNWTFECKGSMDMPSAVITYLKDPPTFPMKRQYNFIITRVVDSEISVVQSSSTGLIVVLIILMIIILCGTVVGVMYKKKIKKFITDKRLGSNTVPKTPEKALDPAYKYCEVDKVNGTEKEDATCYLEIVGTVQPKSLGPIHRV